MTDITADTSPSTPARPALRAGPAALAAVAAAAVIQGADFIDGVTGISGDNDSLMRMTMVRDLLAGQGWFDPMQYRMGLDGGFAMHWSRLVDAPLAAITLAGSALTGSQAAGEAAAKLLWPSLLLALSIFLIVKAATAAYGKAAFLPALVTGAIALASVGIFAPAAVDHHNLQVTLTLAMLTGLVLGSFPAALMAGCAAAAMAAVGAEALPYVAAGGVLAAGLFLFGGEREARAAAGFGTGFAATSLVCLVATVAPDAWLRPACDAFSIVQAGVAAPAGLGLAAAAKLLRGRRFSARLGALTALGLLLGGIVLAAFPQCLADPYAGLDPRLKTLWLDAVVEAQPAIEILQREPVMFVTLYSTPLLALVVLAVRGYTTGWTRAEFVIAPLLAVAVAVSVWQVRGALFAIPLAAVALSGWIARARAHYTQAGTNRALLAMAAAWVMSFNASWSAAADVVIPSPDAAPSKPVKDAAALPGCGSERDYGALAALPPATVLAPSNLGAPILAYTPHRALAGPYHRNTAGNLATLDMLMAEPDEAERLIRAAGVTLVAFCPGNNETQFLADAAPGGLLADLATGRIPAWLQPLSPAGSRLIVYRMQ